ncbi:MAG: hypothetical protein LBH37_01585 [Oscillospiraceae bacterium]|jgi:hypothetical protein|nr:hypothetical protein [Oscillospiraceae bacterium]
MNRNERKRNSNFNANKLDMESVGNDVSGGRRSQTARLRARTARIRNNQSPHSSTYGYDNYQPLEKMSGKFSLIENSALNNWGYDSVGTEPYAAPSSEILPEGDGNILNGFPTGF